MKSLVSDGCRSGIAGKFKASRPAANKALISLVSQGLLEVRPGAGTFVREGVLDYDLERLVSFTDKVRAAGKKPGTQLLEYRTFTAAEATSTVGASLETVATNPLIYAERIRLADGRPVICERRHLVV